MQKYKLPSDTAALSGVHEPGTAKTKVQAAKPIEHAASVGVHELSTASAEV